MKQKIIILLVMVLVLSSCSQKPTNTFFPKNTYTEALNQGDYRFLKDITLSKAREAHKDRLRTKKDIDEIRLGMLEISKQHFSVNEYVLNELDILSYDRLTSSNTYGFDDEALLDYASDSNLYGLNPKKTDKLTLGDEILTGPVLITDLFELDFVKNGDKATKISGMSTALILTRTPYNQEEKDVTISEEAVVEYGKEAASKLYNFLSTLPQLVDIPIVISLFVAESKDINLPGHFVGYLTYHNGKSQYTELNNQVYFLGSETANKIDSDLNELFSIYTNEINKVLYENIGVVGAVRNVNGVKTLLQIEINTQFKSFVEEEILLQRVKELFSQFKDNSYTIRVVVNDLTHLKAIYERKANTNNVNVIRR